MSTLKITGIALLASLTLSACATEDYVNQHLAPVQGQVSDLQGHVQGQDSHLSQLDQSTREALERATAAGKLAEGKFDYAMVLSDDATKFPVNGSTLSPEAMQRLTEFANKLKTDDKNVYLEIQGNTDSTGSAAHNLQLGADRAEAVRRALNEQGVALNRMSTISYGQDRPVASNKTRDGRAQNRRVVIVVLE